MPTLTPTRDDLQADRRILAEHIGDESDPAPETLRGRLAKARQALADAQLADRRAAAPMMGPIQWSGPGRPVQTTIGPMRGHGSAEVVARAVRECEAALQTALANLANIDQQLAAADVDQPEVAPVAD